MTESHLGRTPEPESPAHARLHAGRSKMSFSSLVSVAAAADSLRNAPASSALLEPMTMPDDEVDVCILSRGAALTCTSEMPLAGEHIEAFYDATLVAVTAVEVRREIVRPKLVLWTSASWQTNRISDVVLVTLLELFTSSDGSFRLHNRLIVAAPQILQVSRTLLQSRLPYP